MYVQAVLVLLGSRTTHCTHTISLSQLVTILGWVGATVYVLFVTPVGGTASAAAVVLIDDDAEQP